MPNSFTQAIQDALRSADVEINGSRPWDLKVNNEALYARVLREGTIGFGEAYMDGWWDCEQLDEMICRVMRNDVRKHLKPSFALLKDATLAVLTNRQNKDRAFHIGEAHYDAGNDLYKAMLDKRLTYTCGYWKRGADGAKGADGAEGMTLDEAQEAKLDLVCKKIGLKAGQKVLDIGCGWGSFAKFAAEKYGAHVVGITVSKEQVALAQELCKGLSVEIRLQDYRDVNEQFDHIISLGMFEHVGYKNYREYMEVARRCLKEDGFFLLHTIGGNKSVHSTDPWIEKYIFPNSMLPSIAQIEKATEGLFVTEDLHNFGAYYDKTLMAWDANFEMHWPKLKEHYGERFFRMWRFYLLSCAGMFRARDIQLWQIVLSPRGVKGGYTSIR